MSDALRLLAVLALIAGNAFFVAAEYAVVTARRSALEARGGRRSAVALRLMDDPVRVISTVQVGITAIGILTGAVAEPVVRHVIGDWLPHAVAFALAFLAVTYLSVVLGELVPKALTLDRAETVAVMVARPVDLFARALRPAVWVLQRSAGAVLRPFGVREVVAGDAVTTPEELRALVDEAERGGVIPQAQEELLHNVFDFADREARDLMVPAPDVVWLEAREPPVEALDRALDSGRSRFPVGDGSLDRVIGTAHLRDLALAVRRDTPGAVEDLARPALLVPETKDVGALLREMREARQTLAIVADEYGGTAGILTVEDIVEEIVGEIEDEFELPDATITRLDDHTVEVAGSMTIDDVNEELGTRLPQAGVRTVAGLVFDRLGRRPAPGDEVDVGATALRVADVDGVRITRVVIGLPPRGATDSGGEETHDDGP